MTCPHCGGEMLPEQVFCEHCGKERLLVPVYEPEIEESVAESMHSIMDDLGEVTPNQNHTKVNIQNNTDNPTGSKSDDETKKTVKETHTIKQLNFFIFSILSLVILVVVFSITFYLYTENSYDYHYKKAISAFETHQLEEAVYQTDYCLDKEPDNIELLLLKLHIYLQQSLTEQAMETANQILAYDSENEEALECIIAEYIKNEEYLKLSKFLEKCTVAEIRQKYSRYLASFPEYSEPEGEYDTAISLKLFSVGNGDIYYSLDGTTPSKYSTRYTSPIKLISGEYLVSSVYINEYGIRSEVVIKKYVIQSDLEMLPSVSVKSGTYQMPQMIGVDVPDEEYIVYYTTDGSTPDLDSNIYTDAFPMPLGNSIFKFLMIDSEGNESDIVTCQYSCVPVCYYDTDQAIIILKQKLATLGKLSDPGLPGQEKIYAIDSAVTKDDVVYYLIYEYLQSETGSMIKTGDVFAFNVLDGTIFRAALSSEGNVSLTDF
ncbi:MAG: chitobiase/beta-hexosaminidase C-terminal domain-containing protein [Lachnospiraceae bacterium]